MKCYLATIVYLHNGKLLTSVGLKWVADDVFHALEKIKYATQPETEIISLTMTEDRGNKCVLSDTKREDTKEVRR